MAAKKVTISASLRGGGGGNSGETMIVGWGGGADDANKPDPTAWTRRYTAGEPIRGIARGHKWDARQSPDGRYTLTFANGLEIAGIVADPSGLADKAERIAAERWEVKMEPATV